MSEITIRDVNRQLENIACYVDQPDRLVLQIGSPTNGRAWRLFVSTKSNGRGGLRTFLGLDDGYLGWTKREAYNTLYGLAMGIGTVESILLGPVED